MNRVMLYRSSHSRESIASPNKDIDEEATGASSEVIEDDLKSLHSFFEVCFGLGREP